MKAKKSMPNLTLIILGGTSAVGLAFARQTAQKFETICLVGRNKKALAANKADLLGRGVPNVITHICDLADITVITEHWPKILKKTGRMDACFITYGILGDQLESQRDLKALEQNLTTNFVSTTLWAELAFDHFDKQGHGQLTIIGSVAGDRGRQSNYHYGSAKAGLETFCDGLSHRAALLVGSKVKVLLVKPGFIDTPMTDGIEKGGPLWVGPEKIAKVTDKAINKNKRKVYAPWFWQMILLLIRMTPKFIFHRTKL